MLRSVSLLVSRAFLTLALCAAMAVSGFAHRTAVQQPDPGLVSYVQAGGTLSDICGNADDAGIGLGQTCAACLLVASGLLPGGEITFAPLDLRPMDCNMSRTEANSAHAQLDLSHASRAPPRA